MSSSKKIKGYIFRSSKGGYFREYMAGVTYHKGLAYVYTRIEAQAIEDVCKGWGSKAEGKWREVYE